MSNTNTGSAETWFRGDGLMCFYLCEQILCEGKQRKTLDTYHMTKTHTQCKTTWGGEEPLIIS